MAWPNDRLTTYVNSTDTVPGSQVDASDLNSLQDAIIGGLHGEQQVNLSAYEAFLPEPSKWAFTGIGVLIVTSVAGGTPRVYIPLPVRAGDHITTWRVYGYTDGATTFEAVLTKLTFPSSAVDQDTITSSAAVGYKYADSGAVDLDVGPGEAWFIRADYPSVADRFVGVQLLLDHPDDWPIS